MSAWKAKTKGVQRRYTSPEIKAFAALAASTSESNAARHFRVSRTAVRRAMKIHGVPSRRMGNFTTAEALKLKGWKP